MLTREDVFDKMVKDEKPSCPHCGQTMVIWECPPMTFADGLGWGTPYLYACFNDECPLYMNGWKDIMENYAVPASYRCICDPTSSERTWDCMPVYSPEGGKGCIVDAEMRARERTMEKARVEGLARIEALAQAGDGKAVLDILMDAVTPAAVALRAAELIGDLGALDAIEPLRNRVFSAEAVRAKVEESIAQIHRRHYTRECPFCAEIIKARAVVCKHCGKEVATRQ